MELKFAVATTDLETIATEAADRARRFKSLVRMVNLFTLYQDNFNADVLSL
jgi:hypothetical protein